MEQRVTQGRKGNTSMREKYPMQERQDLVEIFAYVAWAHFSLSLANLAFLVWGDFHVCSRFACSTIPEEKWGLLEV